MRDLLLVATRSKTAFSVIIILLFILTACSGIEPLTDSAIERDVVSETESKDYSELEALYWSRLENSRMLFVQADVDFMIDMISHHAQALIMSNLAPINGASHSVQTLASRIHNAQQDEIASMQKWLRDRNQPVPEVHIEGLMLMVHMEDESSEMDHNKMNHGGHHRDEHSDDEMVSTDHRMSSHSMHHHDMPGMLTQEQLEELAATTGSEFDRKFLTFMIEHHEGAVFMVNELFEANGSANDNEIFDLASDIHVEQITEINRMKLMLEELSSTMLPITELQQPYPDPRVGLASGLFDAEEAIWNMDFVTNVSPPENFIGAWNTDLAFKGNYAIQGNYNGFMVWDISDFANPELVVDYLCPASQSDVSVYQNLLFVSGEGLGGRLDCGTDGVSTAVSEERLRGIRIFDISDIRNPEYISNVQTCRGSHTHSVLVDPKDDDNVYVYVSGSAPVRPEEELPGCVSAFPEDNPDSALFRIEVIKVPLANPALAAIATSPRIFENLTAPLRHGMAPEELAVVERAREAGRYVADYMGQPRIVSDGLVRQFLQQIVEKRGGSGEATAADSLALREQASDLYSAWMEERLAQRGRNTDLGPNQCHDITLYPEVGLAGGACEGYGLILDITDPINPVRIDAVADSNFAYWHSATFNNDGTTVIFTDEWGGGTQAKCRETDPYEWGANAIYSIKDGKMHFESYFKMPAPQTSTENCVAHNGSIVPIPGRDIMVQGWYQGGINVFDFTDPANPIEMAFHDRGPISDDRIETAGSWSVYWYNGALVNSEIARGLGIFTLIPSEFITQNEIDASNTVVLDYLNAQGQPMYVWPSTISLAAAYLDQLERNRELDLENIALIRSRLEVAQNGADPGILTELAAEVKIMAEYSTNHSKMMKLAEVLDDLGNGV